ncbi:MAG: hypothetical protein IPJ69_04890 [Deltaproteobacteria bacterium]|nr:MAG: hypothetical protein IPJ69_04890 [Deltaproteobacteria bacterium]
MKKFKTVSVPKSQVHYYRKRADECFQLSHEARSKHYWFGTCINAVHAAIALSDALCITERGLRYAGSRHDEAVDFYSTLALKDPAFPQSILNFGKLISIKNHAEYAEKNIDEKDASSTLKALERFKAYVLGQLPK